MIKVVKNKNFITLLLYVEICSILVLIFAPISLQWKYRRDHELLAAFQIWLTRKLRATYTLKRIVIVTLSKRYN